MSTGLISNLLSIQPQASTPAGQMEVKMLPREYIMRNPDNKIYVVGDIDKLKEDIRLHGVRQPLEVIRWANGYKLIGGERRLTACEELAKEGDNRFESLPCIIVESKGELDDKIALITANATARDLTDGERVAQYEALKEALTKKKQDGKLEGKVRDELCRILGISTGAAARLNIVATTQNETIKERLRNGEISFMQAVKDAQDYARFVVSKNIEKRLTPEPEVPPKAAPAETLPKPAPKPPQDLHEEIVQSIERTAPSVYRAAPQAAKPEEKSASAVNPAAPEEPKGHDTLYKLACKTLRDDAPWAMAWEDVRFQLAYYSQPLPGGATLWKRVDETRQDAGQPCEDYAIILQDHSFYTCGWISYYAGMPDILTKIFELK